MDEELGRWSNNGGWIPEGSGAKDWHCGLLGLKSELLCEFHCSNKLLLCFPSSFTDSEFPWVPSSEIPSYLCQRDPNKWMGRQRNWEQWRGTFLGWVGREEESWRNFGVVVGEYQRVVGLFELWVDCERHLLLRIPIPNSRVTCCWYLQKWVYGWAKHLSQADGCIIILKDKCLSIFCVILWI
jgi:hypothetical protein